MSEPSDPLPPPPDSIKEQDVVRWACCEDHNDWIYGVVVIPPEMVPLVMFTGMIPVLVFASVNSDTRCWKSEPAAGGVVHVSNLVLVNRPEWC